MALDFDPTTAYRHPRDLERFDHGPRKRVCVVGGGVAGLVAAYELSRFGHQVTLLEQSGRIGGRVWTHYFVDGTYGELGAMRIPANHERVLHYVNEVFNLQTRPFVPFNPKGWCLFRDAGKQRREDWEFDGITHYRSKLAEHPTPLSASAMIQELCGSIEVDAKRWWEGVSNELVTPRMRELDGVSLGSYATSERVFSLLSDSRAEPLLDVEAWEYAGRLKNHIWLENTSLLHWLREANILDADDTFIEIVGGMQKLIDAFVAAIEAEQPGAIQLNCSVRAVEPLQRGALVRWRDADAGPRDQEFDYAICTASAAATARIDFGAHLPATKREALASLSYISAGKTLMRCSRRHWESEDGIFGGSSVTDRPNQQCWYPSDNALRIEPGEYGRLSVAPNRDLDLLEQEPVDIGAGYAARAPEVSEAPGVFLAAYLWGKNGERFASLSDGERDDLMVRSISELHAMNESHLEDVVHLSWDAMDHPGGGAFGFFAPGEHRRYQAALCAPLPVGRPRVFFAGEHLGILQGWIQSSVQTALTATIDVLSSP